MKSTCRISLFAAVLAAVALPPTLRAQSPTKAIRSRLARENKLPTMKTRALLPLALLSLLLLTACNKGAPLPGGYAIFFGDSEDVGLVLPPKGEILVGPKLAKIGNSGTLIFGEVQPPKKPNPSLAGSGTPGFFILDSTTGTIERGLSREEWSKKLQKAGVQGEPELVYPERKGPRF